MFGKEVKDYIGYSYYDVIDNEQMQKTTVQETFLSGQRVKDVVTMDGDGPKKYYEIIAAPIFNELNMLRRDRARHLRYNGIKTSGDDAERFCRQRVARIKNAGHVDPRFC